MAQRREPLLARLYSPAGRALCALVAFSFVLSCGAGLFTPRAEAGDLPRVIVLPYAPIYDGLSATTGAKAAEVLTNELRSSEQLQLVPLKAEKAVAVAAPRSPGPARDDAALAEASERAAKAEELTKKLKFRPAADELEKAIALYEGQHPYIDFSDLVAAYVNVAVAYFRLGLDAEGEKALAQVVRLAPDKKLDADKYPPVFLRAFDNVSRKAQKGPRAAIQVEATAPGAKVFLDGREVGKTPLLVKDVIRGVHFLRVHPTTGASPWANRVEVAGGATAKVMADIGSPGGPVSEITAMLVRNTIGREVIDKVAALGEANSADFVVLGGVHKEGDGIVVSSHLLKVATRKVCLLQRVVFDQEMLGAGIEIYKVGTDIANKLEVFGDPEKIPAKVARDALAPAGGPKLAAVSAEPVKSPEDRVVRRTPPPDAPTAEPRPTEVRKVTAASGEPELIPLEPAGPIDEPKKIDSGAGAGRSKAWIWAVVAVGAAVVAGGAVGGYFIYDASHKPITGKGTITW